MNRLFVRVLLACTLAVLPPSVASAQQDGPPLPIGSQAPAFATQTLAGKPLTLNSLRGHVVILDYWATWCGTCRMATPVLEHLYRKYDSRGLRVVGLSVDDPTSVGRVPAFVKKMHVTYLVSADPKRNDAAAERYNAEATTPSQFVIDKHGVVRWAHAGYFPGEGRQLEAIVRKLLAE